MNLSDLIDALEHIMERHGDMVVELNSGKPVSEVDISYSDTHYPDPPHALPDSVVIK